MTNSSQKSRETWGRSALITTICMLSAARFAFLGHASLRYDEIHNLIRAIDFRVYTGSLPASILSNNSSALFHYLSVQIFGAGEWAARFPVVVQSLVIVLMTFLIARHFLSTRTATIAVFLSLLLPFDFAFARYAQYDIGQTCYFMIGAYFFLCNDSLGRKRNLLGALFFALAFMGKFNSLIIQGIVYLGFLGTAFRDVKAWRYVILNALLFVVGFLIYKIWYFPDFVTQAAAWFSVIVMKPEGATATPLPGVAFKVLEKLCTTVTLPLLAVLLYAIGCAWRQTRFVKILAVTCALYFLVLVFQGRLGERYLNLVMPFVMILAAHGLTGLIDARTAQVRRLILGVLAFGFAAQIFISYSEYFRWENRHEPFRELGSYLQNEIEPTGCRIFLPKSFPFYYVGIEQMESAYDHGLRDKRKGDLYHIAYSPYSLNEQVAVQTSRGLLKQWLTENQARVLSLDVDFIRKDLKAYMKTNERSDDIHKRYSLDELLAGNILDDGDVIFVRDRDDEMYPSLWPRERPASAMFSTREGLAHEVLRTFRYRGGGEEYGRVVRISR